MGHFTVTILSSEEVGRATICPAPYTELLPDDRQLSPAQRFRASVLFSSWVCLAQEGVFLVPGVALSACCDTRCGSSQEGKVDGGEGEMDLHALVVTTMVVTYILSLRK